MKNAEESDGFTEDVKETVCEEPSEMLKARVTSVGGIAVHLSS